MSPTALSRRSLFAAGSALAATAAAAALPAAAAVPAIEPVPLPPLAPAADSKEATIARAEQMVELLRSRFIHDGWKLDEKRAAAFLDSVRKLDPEDGDAMLPIVEWVSDHRQSLDWIFQGDAGVMICRLAAISAAATDDPVIALALEVERTYAADMAAFEFYSPLDNAHCEWRKKSLTALYRSACAHFDGERGH
jgi:hypothetical protein